MAPAIPRSDRATRSSTRSQTAKSQDDTRANKGPVKPKHSGRIKKPRMEATGRAKNSAKSRSKPTAESKSDQRDEADKETIEPDTSTSIPSNVTVLTIENERVKSPIVCHQYTPSTTSTTPSSAAPTTFIFTHGAGGTLSAPAVVHFCTGFSSVSASPLLAFQGSMNLGARAKGFHACYAHTNGTLKPHSAPIDSAGKKLMFGGRSMGARAAVIAATQLASAETNASVRLVLVSYPLQGPKDVRDQILLDLPAGFEVLFIVGDRDAMCPLDLLDKARRKMKASSRLVVVRGADHGMNVRPVRRTREVGEETGRVAARWVSGEMERGVEVVYVGEED